MRGLPSILSLFCNNLNKLKNTEALIYDSVLVSCDPKTTLKSSFWRGKAKILQFLREITAVIT